MSQARQQIPDGAIIQGNNQTGADIPVALFVQRLGAAADQIQLPVDHTKTIYGLTNELIKNGYMGDLQTRGLGIATSAGVITAGDDVEALASGKCQTRTGGGVYVGTANTTTSATDQPVEVMLNLPHGL